MQGHLASKTTFPSRGNNKEADSGDDEIKPSSSSKASAAKRKAYAEMIARCTICLKRIYPLATNKAASALKHPVLDVLICQECYDFYTSAARVRGVDGKDSQCLWCGNSDRIVCCNACPHSFCHDCILRHCGHAEYSRINGRDGEWKCFICDPSPLVTLVSKWEALFKDQKTCPPPAKHAKTDCIQLSSSTGKLRDRTAVSLTSVARQPKTSTLRTTIAFSNTVPTPATLCSAAIFSNVVPSTCHAAAVTSVLPTAATWQAATCVSNIASSTASADGSASSAKAVSQTVRAHGNASLTIAKPRTLTVVCNRSPATATLKSTVSFDSSAPHTASFCNALTGSTVTTVDAVTAAGNVTSTAATSYVAVVPANALPAITDASLALTGGKRIVVKVKPGNSNFKFNKVQVMLPSVRRNGGTVTATVTQASVFSQLPHSTVSVPAPQNQLCGTAVVPLLVTTTALQAGSICSTITTLSTATTATADGMLPFSSTSIIVDNTSPAATLSRPTVGNISSLSIAYTVASKMSPVVSTLQIVTAVDKITPVAAALSTATMSSTRTTTSVKVSPVTLNTATVVRASPVALLSTAAVVWNTSPVRATLRTATSKSTATVATAVCTPVTTAALSDTDGSKPLNTESTATSTTISSSTVTALASVASKRVLVKLKPGSSKFNFNKSKVQVMLPSVQQKNCIVPQLPSTVHTSVKRLVIQESLHCASPPLPMQPEEQMIKPEPESPRPNNDNRHAATKLSGTVKDDDEKVQLSCMWAVNGDNIQGILDELSLPVDLFDSGFQMAQQLLASAKTLPPTAAASMYESAAFSFRTTLAAFLSSLSRAECRMLSMKSSQIGVPAMQVSSALESKPVSVSSAVLDGGGETLGPCIGTVTMSKVARKPSRKYKSRTKKALPLYSTVIVNKASSVSNVSTTSIASDVSQASTMSNVSNVSRVSTVSSVDNSLKVSTALKISNVGRGIDTSMSALAQQRLRLQATLVRMLEPSRDATGDFNSHVVTSVRPALFPRSVPRINSLPRVVARISSATLAKMRMKSLPSAVPSVTMLASDSNVESATVAPIIIAPINSFDSDDEKTSSNSAFT